MPAATCELWWARPSSAGPALLSLLDHAERARHGGFRAPGDAARYLAAHALARIVLGRALGVTPAAVRLTATCRRCGGPHGKPRLAEADDQRPELAAGTNFSLSHSGDWVVVALAKADDAAGEITVGVDVERLRPLADRGLAGRVCSPAELARGDQGGWLSLFRTWTRKEALLKASGDGLAVPMHALTLSPPDEPPELLDWAGRPKVGSAWLADVQPDSGHVGCVALLGPATALRSPQLVEHHASALLASR